MVERGRRAPVSTFHVDGALAAGSTIALPEGAAHHVRVKRLTVGDPVRITDGAGRMAAGAIARIGKGGVDVELARAVDIPRPSPLVLYVPIGDRDRMLWLAEKATELGITAWQPVSFHRSRSVSPRGEGPAFAAKVRARMIAALEQSGGAWLPDVRPDVDVGAAAAVAEPAARYLLDVGGGRLDPAPTAGGAAVLFGPEGGLVEDERARLVGAGWIAARLATTVLRFETAGIAAVAVIRAAQVPLTGGDR